MPTPRAYFAVVSSLAFLLFCLARSSSSQSSAARLQAGTIVISPQFDMAAPFSEGLAAVLVGDIVRGKWGFVDKTGMLVISPQFGLVDRFTEGLARVRDLTTGQSGFIDKTGTFVINPQFDLASPFSEGLAAVLVGKITMGRFGFIDKTGTFAINPQFAFAGQFSEGLAVVRVGDFQTGKFGFIDKTGTLVINPQYDGSFTASFSDGLAAVRVGQTGKFGFIDKTGTFVIAPQFTFAGQFSEGLAAVCIGDSQMCKWGFIDTTGAFVINPQFAGAFDFSGGFAAVRVDDSTAATWGIIDRTGTFVVDPQFDLGPFKEGLAAVFIGDGKTGKWGYISPTVSAQPTARDNESTKTDYEILVASNTGVFVIQARSGRVISRLSSHRATSAELMPNGNVLLVDDAIREVTLSGTDVRNLPLPYSGTNHVLPFTSDTMWVSAPASGANQPGIIALVDWQGRASITLPRFHYPFQTRRVAEDHILVADGSSSLTELSPAGEVLRTIGLSQWATAVAVAKEGDIYYGRPDGYSHLRSTGSEVSTVHEKRVESIDCLPSGNSIIASTLGNFIREVTPDGASVWSIAFDGPNNVRFVR